MTAAAEGETVEALRSRFSGSRAVRFEAGAGGLTRAVLAASRGEAHVYLHGAHVAHYAAADSAGPRRPVLFMSRESWFEPGRPIRGGVPLIFPWFGARAGGPTATASGTNSTPQASPNHGLARLRAWRVEEAGEDAGSAWIELAWHSDDATRAVWPFDFEARYRVTVAAGLSLVLTVRNTGERPMTFEEALHTYLAAGDITGVSVTGLAGVSYLDKATSSAAPTNPKPDASARGAGAAGTESPGIRFAGETDRVYQDTEDACVVDDPAWGRRLWVGKSGSRTTVVWNPWIAKARAMPDFGDDEWRGMLCVETANVGPHAVTLPPGGMHTMTAEIAEEPASAA